MCVVGNDADIYFKGHKCQPSHAISPTHIANESIVSSNEGQGHSIEESPITQVAVDCSLPMKPGEDTNAVGCSSPKKLNEDTSDLGCSLTKIPGEDSSDVGYSLPKTPGEDNSTCAVVQISTLQMSEVKYSNFTADVAKHLPQNTSQCTCKRIC